jgi:hypothetical protein
MYNLKLENLGCDTLLFSTSQRSTLLWPSHHSDLRRTWYIHHKPWGNEKFKGKNKERRWYLTNSTRKNGLFFFVQQRTSGRERGDAGEERIDSSYQVREVFFLTCFFYFFFLKLRINITPPFTVRSKRMSSQSASIRRALRIDGLHSSILLRIKKSNFWSLLDSSQPLLKNTWPIIKIISMKFILGVLHIVPNIEGRTQFEGEDNYGDW